MTRNYRKFYYLLNQMPGAEKGELALQFTGGRTESLQAMSDLEFQCMTACMEGKTKADGAATRTKADDCDTWRKRVMAAIGGWLRQSEELGIRNCESARGLIPLSDGARIKAIACRAAGRKAFNEITLSELRAVYAEFLNKQKVAKRIRELARG